MKPVTETPAPQTDDTTAQEPAVARIPISAKISKYAAYDKLQG